MDREGAGPDVKTGQYRPTLIDKHGALVVETLGRSVLSGVVFGLFVALGLWSKGASGRAFLVGVLAAAVIGSLVVFLVTSGAMQVTGNLTKRFLEGSSDYERDYSRHDALAISGKIPEALMLYEQEIAGDPAASGARFRAAELYLQLQNPTRAIDLLRQIQKTQGVRQEDDIRASYRLMDIYQGAARDDGRVLVELRRLVDRYPGTPAAARWRAAIAELRQSRA